MRYGGSDTPEIAASVAEEYNSAARKPEAGGLFMAAVSLVIVTVAAVIAVTAILHWYWRLVALVWRAT